MTYLYLLGLAVLTLALSWGGFLLTLTGHGG